MALVGNSLNAVTSGGPGTAIFFDTPKADTSMQLVFTGSPGGGTVVLLEGTIDGSTWATLATYNSGSNGIASASGKPVIGVRANLSGFGTGPATLTATVAAA